MAAIDAIALSGEWLSEENAISNLLQKEYDREVSTRAGSRRDM
jgi:hypothetical protein